jgi:hypothetical protein
MTDKMIALACRAVACRGWRWMPGMLYQYREESDKVTVPTKHYWSDPTRVRDHDPDVPACFGGFSAPDLTDPATLGCLLALVREAWKNPKVWAEYVTDSAMWSEGDWQLGWACPNGEPIPPDIACDTEAEILVAALEAAP